jgi:hypothetical protein
LLKAPFFKLPLSRLATRPRDPHFRTNSWPACSHQYPSHVVQCGLIAQEESPVPWSGLYAYRRGSLVACAPSSQNEGPLQPLQPWWATPGVRLWCAPCHRYTLCGRAARLRRWVRPFSGAAAAIAQTELTKAGMRQRENYNQHLHYCRVAGARMRTGGYLVIRHKEPRPVSF